MLHDFILDRTKRWGVICVSNIKILFQNRLAWYGICNIDFLIRTSVLPTD